MNNKSGSNLNSTLLTAAILSPTTIKEAAAKIEELTGIKRGQTQTRQFLTAMGMRCLKVGVI